MNANRIILYYSPGACSRVTMTALEEAGASYTAQRIDIAKGATSSEAYLGINPKAKVPALSWNGRNLTENPALLYFIAERFPVARLFPAAVDPLDKVDHLADLCWCASSLHPLVRQIARPAKWTTLAPEGVREAGLTGLSETSQMIEQRVGDGWWYGKDWSIIDAYLCWAYSVAVHGGFETDDFVKLKRYLERAAAWPSYRKALKIEK